MMSVEHVSVLTLALAEGKEGKTAPKYQQVVRSWKVVQPADFRDSVVLECTGKCEKQAKQDGSSVLACSSCTQIMIARLRGRRL